MSPAFPVRFNLSEYVCSWLAGPDRDENGEETGGFVCVRIAHTGDDSQDWIESDVMASTQSEAADVARALIAEHEDAMKSCATPGCKRSYATDRLLGGLMVPLCSTCATRVDSEAEDARTKRRARKTKTTPRR